MHPSQIRCVEHRLHGGDDPENGKFLLLNAALA